jgi:hypothetical protein
MIEKWAEALDQQDEDLQQQVESAMPRFVTLKNLGAEEFNILARCVEGDSEDTLDAVDEIDLIKAVSEEEGPWIMAFRQPTVEAIARMSIDKSLLRRWVKAVAQYSGREEDDCRVLLSANAAKTLQGICSQAVKERLGVFVCFYG